MRTLSLVIGAIVVSLCTWSITSRADEGFLTVTFPTKGGIEVTADLYVTTKTAGTVVLLFHQAGWSRGEYREIAPKLVDAGYRVMAVDQRSGRGVNGVVNQTHRRALKKKLPTGYLDAYADLEAALRYARETLKATRVIVWGSSYSASLVLRLAAEHEEDVAGVMAFSPGEYFGKARGATYVRDFAAHVKQPLFVTSAKRERPEAKAIFDASPADKKILFTPASQGQHGARALWSKSPDNDVYWTAVNGFLRTYAPPKPTN